MTGFALPRVFTGLTIAMLIGAVITWPVGGLPVASGLLVICAACLGWMAWDLDRSVRRIHVREASMRRRTQRYAADPAVLARVYVLPARASLTHPLVPDMRGYDDGGEFSRKAIQS